MKQRKDIRDITEAVFQIDMNVGFCEVGNLAELLRVSGIENSTLVDEINSINERLKWQDMTE